VRAVVGLGNPGPKYERTRHNIGFLVADHLAAGAAWSTQHNALTARWRRAGEEVLLVKPQTYMNRSGTAVRSLAAEVGSEPAQILVVFDDFLLDFGRLRLRRGGSDGGHNGLASVLQKLGSDQVPRLRLGVGPVPDEADDIDFVLAPFGETEDVDGLVDRGGAAVETWLSEGIEAAMNRFNGCAGLSVRSTHEPTTGTPDG
jgi:PTH1 family peptidyl-tRNA hydrolase